MGGAGLGPTPELKDIDPQAATCFLLGVQCEAQEARAVLQRTRHTKVVIPRALEKMQIEEKGQISQLEIGAQETTPRPTSKVAMAAKMRATAKARCSSSSSKWSWTWRLRIA